MIHVNPHQWGWQFVTLALVNVDVALAIFPLIRSIKDRERRYDRKWAHICLRTWIRIHEELRFTWKADPRP